PHDEPAPPAQLGGVCGELEVGQAAQQGLQGGAAFESGQGGAETVVDAVAVSEVLVVPAGEIEGVGLREACRVAVRRGQADQDGVAGGDALPADGQRLGGEAPGGQFHGAVVTEQLLYTGVEQ